MSNSAFIFSPTSSATPTATSNSISFYWRVISSVAPGFFPDSPFVFALICTKWESGRGHDRSVEKCSRLLLHLLSPRTAQLKSAPAPKTTSSMKADIRPMRAPAPDLARRRGVMRSVVHDRGRGSDAMGGRFICRRSRCRWVT